MRAILPDILTRFPPGSIVVWRRSMWGKIQYIPARVVGKTPRQGNQRIAIDVLYIASDGHGDKAIFVKRMGCVSAASIMTLAAWYNQQGSRAAPHCRALTRVRCGGAETVATAAP